MARRSLLHASRARSGEGETILRRLRFRLALAILSVTTPWLLGGQGANAAILHDIEECSTYCGDADEPWCGTGDAAECWETAYRDAHRVADCLQQYRECVAEAREKACAVIREAREQRALKACGGVWICEYDTRQRFLATRFLTTKSCDEDS